MSFVAKDRVKVSTSSTGTGAFNLGSAVSPAFQSFSDAGVPDGSTIHYSAFTSTQFECGQGTFSLAGPSLSRDSVFASSNAGLIVNFTTSPTVIIAFLAETLLTTGVLTATDVEPTNPVPDEIWIDSKGLIRKFGTQQLDPKKTSTTVTLSNSNLTAVYAGNGSDFASSLSDGSITTGQKFVFSVHIDNAPSTTNVGIGICSADFDFERSQSSRYLGSDLTGMAVEGGGGVWFAGGPITSVSPFVNGDTVTCAVDFDAKRIWFKTNSGNWNNSGTANPDTGSGGIDISAINGDQYWAAINFSDIPSIGTFNFSPSSGLSTFTAWKWLIEGYLISENKGLPTPVKVAIPQNGQTILRNIYEDGQYSHSEVTRWGSTIFMGNNARDPYDQENQDVFDSTQVTAQIECGNEGVSLHVLPAGSASFNSAFHTCFQTRPSGTSALASSYGSGKPPVTYACQFKAPLTALFDDTAFGPGNEEVSWGNGASPFMWLKSYKTLSNINTFPLAWIVYEQNSGDEFCPEVHFAKSRGTPSTKAAVSDFDEIGGLVFWAYDGSAYQMTAAITSEAKGNASAGVAPQRLVFFTSETNTAGNARRLQIGPGLQVGAAPTGGDKGAGTINCSGDVYKNNSAYTNPDYALEHYFTGSIREFAENEGAADYTGIVPLDELEDNLKKNLRLPGMSNAPMGAFERSDKALEKIEELTIYITQLHKRIKELENG